ncbi:bifunctional diguanylate cyclase/phosphodiesterase [Vibrio hepatarius]|uniref:bifunctional diguanylate cyclase/phosphodiesterase n=1 Tax=Vibrio hepatarius TaxID=171383 RepID=UPI00142E029E|nr:EAL domain-containing protein [Vibrio hepatarius]NIY83720.1 EAL domain-containing protein [Vibrio hepatarius]
MNTITDKKLLKLITYAPATIVATFMLIMIVIITRGVIISSENTLKLQLDEYQQHGRNTLISRVEYVTQHITYARSQTEKQLKNNVETYVHEAYKLAARLFKANTHLPQPQVKKIITDALRDFRFHHRRGHIGIYQTDGLNIMQPIGSQIESSPSWQLEEADSNYIVRSIIEQVKTNGETFYDWRPIAPEDDNNRRRKISFGKLFEPYNWVIIASDSVQNVENDIKTDTLNWLQNVRFRDFGYVFVIDEFGTILAHINQDLIGRNAFQMEDPNGFNFGERTIAANKQFINYVAPLGPKGLSNYDKTSYVVKDSSWGWVIGAGMYDEITNRYIADKVQQARIEQNSTLKNMLVMGVITTIVVALSSIVLSRLIAKRFLRFEKRINLDFNKLKSNRDELAYLANHDILTGLPNRSQLLKKISSLIEKSTANNRMLAIMFVDLDDFKKVNDLYGHSVGDKLLHMLGEQFESFLNPDEYVARFGGDEFVFCFPNLWDITEAQSKVDCIKNVFTQQFTIDGKVLFVSCSVGVSMYPVDGDKPEVLISKAEIVLYRTKARQKGDVLFFDESIEKQVKYEFVLERELRSALNRNELTVVYQPQVNAQTGELYGVESLLRWHNRHLGHVSPIEFIPLAEEIGLIDQLGGFVLEQACKEFSTVFPSPESKVVLSINISPLQLLNGKFIEQLQSSLRTYRLQSDRVNLEITENVLIHDLPKVAPIIAQLKRLGFTVSLDDFGTGYSSLSYLSNLSLDELKIDKAFVDKMLTSSQSDSLIKAIIALAKSINVRIVAEGVETKKQKELLTDYGCDVLQGYLIDRPISIEQVEKKYSSSLNVSGDLNNSV